MDFQEAIRKIEERGDFNRFAEVKPIFENRLEELKPGDYTEEGLCYYYLLVSYLKAQLVHETEESIDFYERMDIAFTKQQEVYEKEYKKFSWSEMADFFRLMERCYGSLEYLYTTHDFKKRHELAYRRKMQFRQDSFLFNRKYGRFFEYKFLEFTSHYGTSLIRWALTTFVFATMMALLYGFHDLLAEPAERIVSTGASWFDYIYFSMITLTTVGFGDIAPITLAAKVLVVFEAFLGFVMLGIFIGLIQKKF